MAQCTRCGKATSVWERDLTTGVCSSCRAEDTAKVNEEHQRRVEAEKAKRATIPATEPSTEPLDGLVLIGISVVLAIFAGMLIASGDASILGFIVAGVAGMLYLAGVIRWAVSGSQFLQLNRLRRQNTEIIEILELLADKGRNAGDLELLRRLRESGQITEEEYRKQRTNILRAD